MSRDKRLNRTQEVVGSAPPNSFNPKVNALWSERSHDLYEGFGDRTMCGT